MNETDINLGILMTIETQLERLSVRIDDMAAFIHAFAGSLPPPEFSAQERCFRYKNPGVKHFCLLRSCRIISALYACVALVRSGFSQESAVILRTVLEFCSQVDFVVLNERNGTGTKAKADNFVDDYFRDDWKPREEKQKRLKLRQEDVHKAVGERLDDSFREETDRVPASVMMSNSYINFSNYVHGRHVESMDLFGGRPGHFHLFGMSNTPKDGENIEILDTLITTAEICLVGIIQGLSLTGIVYTDQALTQWYRSRLE